MDAAHPALSPETLLEHEHFVRSVARGLVGESHSADDVAQETWLRALEHRPDRPGAMRAWLASVTRNLARDARRGAARRSLREERAARAEAVESVDTSFERLSVQQDVVAAILELGEPYRSVILLRYYQDLEPSVIAERLGAKAATVRTQLVRAHEELRKRLDKRHGRESWAALLLPVGAGSGAGVEASAVRLLPVAGILAGLSVTAVMVWVIVGGERDPSSEPRVTLAEASRIESATQMLVPALIPEEGRDVLGREQSPVTRVAVAGSGARERIFARAELLDRRTSKRERSRFNFEQGLRHEPEMGRQRIDWDLEFTGGRFDSCTVVNDFSVIADLGPLSVRDLWNWSGIGEGVEHARVELNHTYFLWSRDHDTDLAVAFEVVEFEPGESCVLEWYATSNGRTVSASFHDESPERSLATKLAELRETLQAGRALNSPTVLLQARNGSGGGNEYRAFLSGDLERFDAAPAFLDIYATIDRKEDGIAYCEGGFIPKGMVFVVTSASYWGISVGDNNGPPGFAVVLGGETIVEHAAADPLAGSWFGRVEIRPGEELKTYLELKNSSAGEVVLQGELVQAQ